MPSLGPGSSRTMSLYKKCAVIQRGDRKCAWCCRALRLDWHSIDHVNDDHDDNREGNMVPACPPCNSARAQGSEAFAIYLREERNVDPTKAAARVAKQLRTPIDRESAGARELARDWYKDRIAYQNETGTKRSAESRARRLRVAALVALEARQATDAQRKMLRAEKLTDDAGKMTSTGREVLRQWKHDQATLAEIPF